LRSEKEKTRTEVKDADFEQPQNLKMPSTSVREWLSRYKFYQKLHELKVKLREKRFVISVEAFPRIFI